MTKTIEEDNKRIGSVTRQKKEREANTHTHRKKAIKHVEKKRRKKKTKRN